MTLISEEYRSMLSKMHRKLKKFGVGSKHRRKYVLSLGYTDILDYGCGKGKLGIGNKYDPAIPAFSGEPGAADLVVCTDVLEHIEPEFLDEVLSHIQSKMKVSGYFTISCAAARKRLADGRNAHLIIQSPEWWVEKLSEFFIVVSWLSHKENREVVELEVHLKQKEPLCEPSLPELQDKTGIISPAT